MRGGGVPRQVQCVKGGNERSADLGRSLWFQPADGAQMGPRGQPVEQDNDTDAETAEMTTTMGRLGKMRFYNRSADLSKLTSALFSLIVAVVRVNVRMRRVVGI